MTSVDLEFRRAHLTKLDRAFAAGAHAGEFKPDTPCAFGEGPERRSWKAGYRLDQSLRPKDI